MRKIHALLGVLLLAAISTTLVAKERAGAEVILAKKDGLVVKGELVAIKNDSVLLVDASGGGDSSIVISDIRSIKIVKGSKAGLGIAIGALVGGAAGALIGHEIGKPNGGLIDVSAAITVGGAAGGVFAGGLAGYLIGHHTKKGEILQFEGESPERIEAILGKLRSLARVPDFR